MLATVGFFWQWFRWWLFVLLFPITYGSVWIVFTYSSLLIGDNGNIFLRTTRVAGGHLTVGQAHTGDLIVHTLPVLITLLFTAASWNYLRKVVRDFQNLVYGSVWLCLFVAWFVLSPLIIMGIYALVNDPIREYPSDIDGLFGAYVVVLFTVIFNGLLLILFIVDGRHEYEMKHT